MALAATAPSAAEPSMVSLMVWLQPDTYGGPTVGVQSPSASASGPPDHGVLAPPSTVYDAIISGLPGVESSKSTWLAPPLSE